MVDRQIEVAGATWDYSAAPDAGDETVVVKLAAWLSALAV